MNTFASLAQLLNGIMFHFPKEKTSQYRNWKLQLTKWCQFQAQLQKIISSNMKERPDLRKLSLFVIETKTVFHIVPIKNGSQTRPGSKVYGRSSWDRRKQSTIFFVGKRSTNLKPRKSFIPSLLKVKLSYFLGIFFCGKFKERWVDEIPFHLLKVYISLAIDIFGDWTPCNPICNIHLQGCFMGLKAIQESFDE